MENEIIETEVIEDVNEFEVSEDVSIDDVSEVENIPEKIILEESEVENIEDSEGTTDLEELLRNYFSTNSSLGSEVGSIDLESVSEVEAPESEPSIDYTSLITDILTSTEDTKQLVSDTYDNLVEFQSNNIFSGSIEDISLTNQLLIILIIVLLFNGLIDFARRIF